MKVAFICVNYNNAKVTLQYINNVSTLKGEVDVKIIIVDNASKADDIQYLEREMLAFREAILIKSEKNGGYFFGLNLGIACAIEQGYNQYQIIGNNDIEFHADFLDRLGKLKLKQDELVVAPDVITNDGIHENPHIVERVTLMRKFIYRIYFSNYFFAKMMTVFYSDQRKSKPFDPESKHIYMGIGALYILTPNFFQYFSKLWDEVFLYGEEAIFAGQIRSVNGRILYDPSLKCNHNESASTSRLGFKNRYSFMRESYKKYRKYL